MESAIAVTITALNALFLVDYVLFLRFSGDCINRANTGAVAAANAGVGDMVCDESLANARETSPFFNVIQVFIPEKRKG